MKSLLTIAIVGTATALVNSLGQNRRSRKVKSRYIRETVGTEVCA